MSFGCSDYGPPTIAGPNSCAGTFSTHSVWYYGGGVGLLGQEIWTYAHGTVPDSTATYPLSGLDTTHVMQIQAYIPNNYSDTSHAHYHYCSPGGGCADGYVNQNNYTNQWAVVGAVCTTDGTATITLADDGGDVYPAIVGADAIRAVRMGGLVCRTRSEGHGPQIRRVLTVPSDVLLADSGPARLKAPGSNETRRAQSFAASLSCGAMAGVSRYTCAVGSLWRRLRSL